MNQRLIWNFEFSDGPSRPIHLPECEKESLKWEFREFFPGDDTIILPCLDPKLLDLKNYTHKSKDDLYYIINDENYNIKKRRDELLYKPLIQHSKYALGFDSKIILQSLEDLTEKKPHQIEISKELFRFKFATKPKIKLELSRIELNNQIYYGVCIEGRSQKLVEQISELFFGKQATSDYVTFLKKTLTS